VQAVIASLFGGALVDTDAAAAHFVPTARRRAVFIEPKPSNQGTVARGYPLK
jgi:hypothetical protein